MRYLSAGSAFSPKPSWEARKGHSQLDTEALKLKRVLRITKDVSGQTRNTGLLTLSQVLYLHTPSQAPQFVSHLIGSSEASGMPVSCWPELMSLRDQELAVPPLTLWKVMGRWE